MWILCCLPAGLHKLEEQILTTHAEAPAEEKYHAHTHITTYSDFQEWEWLNANMYTNPQCAPKNYLNYTYVHPRTI
jgi:hypothetical protein